MGEKSREIFARLSTEDQVAALAQLARNALQAWRLADAGLDLIKYRENAVFAVDARAGEHGDGSELRYVLRVHRPRYRSDDDLRSEAAWTRALAAAGVETAAMLQTTDGDILSVAEAAAVPEPRQCDLMAWVDGEALGSLEHGVKLGDTGIEENYRRVGEIAARIHEHGLSWEKPSWFSRPRWDVDALLGDDPIFGRFWELDLLDQSQLAPLQRARELARERLDELGPPDLLIHGDAMPDNLLVSGDRVRVIDFDDCGWSWAGLELATSVFPLLLAGGFDAGLRGFLSGYQSVREFPAEQVDALPHLLMARGLSYLGWPVGRPEIESARQFAPLASVAMVEMAKKYLAEHS